MQYVIVLNKNLYLPNFLFEQHQVSFSHLPNLGALALLFALLVLLTLVLEAILPDAPQLSMYAVQIALVISLILPVLYLDQLSIVCNKWYRK